MSNQNQANQQRTRDHESDNSTQGRKPPQPDTADAATIDRLEAITGGAEDEEDESRYLFDPDLSREMEKLDAATEEEVEALRINLVQDGGESHTTDTSGLVIDDAAEAEIARFTEVGPMQPDQGVVSAEPGRDDTSRTLRRHHPNTTARAQDVVEGNLDEPASEQIMDRKVDEGTAA